jgi:hypothetical protein
MDGIEKALTAIGMAEEYGRRGLCSKAPNNSEVPIGCDPGTDPDLRKFGKLGDLSKGRSLFAFMNPNARYTLLILARIPGARTKSTTSDSSAR